MKRLYFDTETTGVRARENTPLDQCPHIVQLAAVLHDDTHGEVTSINLLVKPDGWEIPQQAAEIHGISTAKAAAFGLPIKVVMATFSQLSRVADQIVAHNLDFDLYMADTEFCRLEAPHIAMQKQLFCTMRNTENICKLPSKFKGRGYKWPTLMEAYQHLFNETFDGAHDALVDVRACLRIHQFLITNKLIAL